jgi:D-alanyl-D-alanine carboxypeptidase/D-alanyl-D-alanine-endopeptidase (penicillin-binding protein 4)
MKAFVITINLFLLGTFSIAQTKIDSVFTIFKNDRSLSNASIGFRVVELENDSAIFTYNDSVSLTSASTVKLFSTASAFEILGKEYFPKTYFYLQGNLGDSGVFTGDLIIKGAADISIGSSYFSNGDSINQVINGWVDSIYKLGIHKIKGRLIGDGSAFGYKGAPDGWSWEDLGNYYGAFPSGLSIYDNTLRYYFNVGPSRTKPVLSHTFPVVSGLQLKNNLQSLPGVGDNSLVYGAPYSYDRSIRGSLSSNSKMFLVKGSLPDPEIQFLQALKEAFIIRGIEIEGELVSLRNSGDQLDSLIEYTKMKPILQHNGKSVNDIAYWTNMKSVNIFAETLVSWIGFESNGDGSIENGVNVIEKYWKSKIYTEGLNLTDGSGLSRSNSVNTRNFCSLLSYMYKSKYKDDFLSTLPVSGQTGTLSYFCKGQCSEGKIQAKSGTMRRVKSYAGYVNTMTGKKLAFALIVNNYSGNTNSLLKKMEQVMNAMYLY